MQNMQTQWAVVTGASSGLGVALATGLARRGHNLVLVARREAPMQALAVQLRQDHGVQVVVEVLDLGGVDSAIELQGRLAGHGIDAGIFINNAAFGLSSEFIDHAPERLRAMLQLDIMAMTELTHLFARRMAERGRGHLLLVASLAAYQPTPMLAAYGAAKAYLLSLGEALHVELAPKNVGVTVLSPGLMQTEFFDVSGYTPPPSTRVTMLTPQAVAEIGLDAMFAGKASVIAGRLNRLVALLGRFVSRVVQAKVMWSMRHR